MQLKTILTTETYNLKDQTHIKHVHQSRTIKNTKNTYGNLKPSRFSTKFVADHNKLGQDKTS